MFSILYVSTSLVAPDRADVEIADIVRLSVARNQSAQITGALIHTGDRFAQCLEGPDGAVRALMARIQRDSRHTELAVIEQGAIEARRFAGWSMAYSGQATFAAVTVRRALEERDDPSGYGAARLMRLLQELFHASPRSETPPAR